MINTFKEIEEELVFLSLTKAKDDTGKYCLYSDYCLLKKEYDQLKKEYSLAIDKLHEYRHMVKALTEKESPWNPVGT